MPPKGPEQNSENPTLADIEAAAKKADATKVGADFDKNQDKYTEQQYKQDKDNIITNIINRSINPDYNRTPDVSDYKRTLFTKEDPTLVKWYVAYYNTQVTKSNTQNNTHYPMIRINNFLENFEKERPQPTMNITESKAKLVALAPEKINQEVGKFIEIPETKQQEIMKKFWEVVSANQKITALKLYGFADATRVTELGEKAVQDKFTGLRQILIDKWMSPKNLPVADYFKGIDTMVYTQKQKVLNDGRAQARAMMEIAFLPAEQIKYINDNSVKIETIIDAKQVGTKEKWNQYTGGKIEMESTGNNKLIVQMTEEKDHILQMLDIRQVNYAYAEGNSYYMVGWVRLDNQNGSVNTSNVTYKEINASNFRAVNNLHTFNAENKDKKAFFENGRVNTLWIIINNPWSGKTVNTLNEIDPRITNTGMKLAKDGKDINAFATALTEFKDKSGWDANKSGYVDNIITILQSYKEVDQKLNKAKEVIKTTL